LTECESKAASVLKYHAMKAYREHGGKVPHIVDLFPTWRKAVIFML